MWADTVRRMDSRVIAALGEVTTVVPTRGSAVAVTGVFDEEYHLVDAGQAGVDSAVPAVLYQLADLPVDPKDDEGLRLTIRGTEYEVVTIKPDGHGAVRLLLQVA